MTGGLQDIKGMVDAVVEQVAHLLEVEVCVTDEGHNIVSSTDAFLQRKGGQVRHDFLQPLLAGTEPLLLTSPGLHPLCKGCIFQHNCPHTIEVDVPILVRERAVGMFSVVGFTPEARHRIMANGELLIRHLSFQARLLSNELAAQEAERRSRYLETLMDSITEGVALTDDQGYITQCNARFLEILGLRALPRGRRIDAVISGVPALAQLRELAAAGHTYPGQGISHSLPHCSFYLRPLAYQRRFGGAVLVLHADSTPSGPEPGAAGSPMAAIIGQSPAILAAKARAQRVAASHATVLLTGESGTGKELFARAIHAMSPRSQGPFVAINCAAIPETLLESELFGYDSGAFTGARKGGKLGKLEQAQGGTLFLDELGDMPLPLQAKLLRVLEERRVERVGGTQSIALDFRVISATNQDLEHLVRSGGFRPDLYYRLAVVPIQIPPLRERQGDMSLLARQLLPRLAAKHGRSQLHWAPEALDALERCRWPGNARELINAIEYAVHLSPGPVVTLEDLPPAVALREPPALTRGGTEQLTQAVEAAERETLQRMLSQMRNRSAVARALGISRSSLYRKLRQYNLA